MNEQLIILINPQTKTIAHVARDVPHLRQIILERFPATIAITGQPAMLLFVALAGRDWGEEPEDANRSLSSAALAQLFAAASVAANPDGYLLALRVVAANGYQLRPNLGCTILDDHGRPVSAAEDYRLAFAGKQGVT